MGIVGQEWMVGAHKAGRPVAWGSPKLGARLSTSYPSLDLAAWPTHEGWVKLELSSPL